MKKTARSSLIITTFITAAALFIGLILIFPIIYCVCTGFKPRSELSVFPPTVLPSTFRNLENFRTAFRMAPIFRFMLNSLAVSAMGSILRVVFAVLAAYSMAYFEFKGKKLLFFVLLGTMMLPADTLLVTNYLTVSRMRLLNTYFGMCVTSLAGAAQMFMLRQNFKTIPRTLRDAAFIDGCGDLRYLLFVIVPLSRPVILTLLVQSFVTFWNTYMWPLLVTTRPAMYTVQVGVTMLTDPLNTNFSVVMAALSVLLIPSFLLFSILRRNLLEGITAGSVVG
ncbi:MAG: carbohydrate ABC transporter permease [Treponema sp.]|jgi:sn-glycerol 3-phosphate transport system permease protein|nr:carbohydrate ABC transporter permease [Treponema sp.]